MTRRKEIEAGVAAVRARIEAACAAVGREPGEVTLIAVSKTWPATDVRLIEQLGVRDLAENRDQEARVKAAEVADLPLRWHFVGRLQRNKCRSVATYADAVHSLDRPELVDALDDAARRAGRRVGALVQVSLDGPDAPAGRGGVPAQDVPALCDRIAAAGGLELRGVMAVAPPGGDPAPAFAALAAVAAEVRARHPGADVISAGMSADLEAAIAAGATHVRVGTAVFGGRPPMLLG